jgi:hypothetical protein
MDSNIIGKDNQFECFKTPAAIMAYFSTELPEALDDLLQGIVDAGATTVSLCWDCIELAEMGHCELGEQVMALAETPRETMDICDTDFMPRSLKDANEIVLKAVAAVTEMKVRERCEGYRIKWRDHQNPIKMQNEEWQKLTKIAGEEPIGLIQ